VKKRNPYALQQAQQRAVILSALASGPKPIQDLAAVLCVGASRASDIMGALRKLGDAELVHMAGGARVWVRAADAKALQREQHELMQQHNRAYQRRVGDERRAKKQGIALDDFDRDDWPVRQSRVSRWAPIRPPVPASVFTLGLAA
jgi:hypothetical protein